MKVVRRYYFFPVFQNVLRVFVQAYAKVGAGYVHCVAEAMLLQRHDGVVAPLAGAAMEVYGTVFRDFIYAPAKFAERDIDRVFQMARGVFSFFPHVHDVCAAFCKAAHR